MGPLLRWCNRETCTTTCRNCVLKTSRLSAHRDVSFASQKVKEEGTAASTISKCERMFEYRLQLLHCSNAVVQGDATDGTECSAQAESCKFQSKSNQCVLTQRLESTPHMSRVNSAERVRISERCQTCFSQARHHISLRRRLRRGVQVIAAKTDAILVRTKKGVDHSVPMKGLMPLSHRLETSMDAKNR